MKMADVTTARTADQDADAQQARERRKQYLSELEGRVSQLDQRNAELKETLSTLQRENFMLRQVARNTAQAADAPPSH
ncbi:unnamed protein product [Closterium sp. NIES-65]|nr:unnamed protein product [Closterium sp. NIES-65]